MLENNLRQVFSLSDEAVTWLLDMFQVIQLFDDVADNDDISRKDLNDVIWKSLVAMPNNPFYLRNLQILSPIIATAILKWQASDSVERNGFADEKSYMWRAGYYDLVLISMQIEHGADVATQNAEKVMELYGETYKAYKEEFNNA